MVVVFASDDVDVDATVLSGLTRSLVDMTFTRIALRAPKSRPSSRLASCQLYMELCWYVYRSL